MCLFRSSDEVEIVLKLKVRENEKTTWMAVGWKPWNLNLDCLKVKFGILDYNYNTSKAI